MRVLPLAVVLVVFVACTGPATNVAPPASPTPVNRLAAIPPEAIKVTPADDP